MASFFFFFFATLLVISALTVVLARNPLYNVLSLVLAVFCLSSLFMQMEAYFVGIILLLVYAGAVMVFFLFVVMCLNLNAAAHINVEQGRFRFFGGLLGAAFLAEFYVAIRGFLAAQTFEPTSIRGTIEVLGKIIFTEYLLPFELTSFLLFIAIFGIVSLAKGEMETNWEKTQEIKRAEND